MRGSFLYRVLSSPSSMQHRLQLHLKAELGKPDDQVGMAEHRHLLVGEEHMREVLQRIEGDAALLDQRLRDRLAGDVG